MKKCVSEINHLQQGLRQSQQRGAKCDFYINCVCRIVLSCQMCHIPLVRSVVKDRMPTFLICNNKSACQHLHYLCEGLLRLVLQRQMFHPLFTCHHFTHHQALSPFKFNRTHPRHEEYRGHRILYSSFTWQGSLAIYLPPWELTGGIKLAQTCLC